MNYLFKIVFRGLVFVKTMAIYIHFKYHNAGGEKSNK